jgi:iron complex outermembrane recepter protein
MSWIRSATLVNALRPSRYLASASLIAGLSFSLAPAAWAQDATNALASDEAQVRPSSRSAAETEIVVTGSLFRQRENQSNLVTVQTREDLERRGVTSAAEALASLAQNQPLTVPQTTAFSGTGFASYANLRSLGSANTLVLLNGKRVVNNPFQAQGVDLNTIPMALIERVETLADGASSIYGTDAVAGVINFITRDTVNGVRASGISLISERGDGARYNAVRIR